MKIGILTLFHGNNNWGGTLQGIALKKLIEREYPGATVDLIDYRSSANVIYASKLQQAAQYTPMEIMKKAGERLICSLHSPAADMLRNRKQLFQEFREIYTTNRHIYTDMTLPEMGKDYEHLIVGSDQIWNPNVAKPGFFLKDTGSSCRKTAYAASISRRSLSGREKTVIVPLLEDFDNISVRERSAKKILDSCLQKPIEEVLDPALMFDAEGWINMLNLSNTEEKPYALAFFFSDSLCYRSRIERFCEKRGLELWFIPFASKYIKNDEKGNCRRLFDIGPREFVSIFRNASYIFTDSFHGLVFAMIFRKNFWAFARDRETNVSKNTRIYDLLNKFGLSDRLIRYPEEILTRAEETIDFDKVEYLLENYRKKSLEFLYRAIGMPDDCPAIRSVTVADLQKEDCSGCGLCKEVCGKDSIRLVYDKQGFAYPTIDSLSCVHCGKCLKICLSKNRTYRSAEKARTYIGYCRDNKARERSSSGGLFGEIAKVILKKGGIIYGAAFDEGWQVKHRRITELSQLDLLMRSKYVQSDMADIYQNLMQDLQQGVLVLFSGTPCQTAAVKEFSRKASLDSKLVLVDFVCHGVPSPGVWGSYLQYVSRGRKIQEINFRDKTHAGWHDYFFHIGYEEHEQLNESHDLNIFMQTFLSDINLRLSCYFCKFKKENYAADLTLGDAWKIEKVKPEWADDRGTSLFIVRSRKGYELLDQLPESFIYSETDYVAWTKFNSAIVNASPFRIERDNFFQQFERKETSDFWIDQKKIFEKRNWRYISKKIIKKLGIEKFVRQKL